MRAGPVTGAVERSMPTLHDRGADVNIEIGRPLTSPCHAETPCRKRSIRTSDGSGAGSHASSSG